MVDSRGGFYLTFEHILNGLVDFRQRKLLTPPEVEYVWGDRVLFSPTPKASRKELFDREQELSQLQNLLKIYPIVVVGGLRKVGKSSLVRAFLSE